MRARWLIRFDVLPLSRLHVFLHTMHVAAASDSDGVKYSHTALLVFSAIIVDSRTRQSLHGAYIYTLCVAYES